MKSKEENSRPFIGIQFDCCHVYARVYRQPEDQFYQARCPKCLRSVKVTVDEAKGTDTKFLRATFK